MESNGNVDKKKTNFNFIKKQKLTSESTPSSTTADTIATATTQNSTKINQKCIILEIKELSNISIQGGRWKPLLKVIKSKTCILVDTGHGEANNQTKNTGDSEGNDLGNVIIDYAPLKGNIKDHLFCKHCITERRDFELDNFCVLLEHNNERSKETVKAATPKGW